MNLTNWQGKLRRTFNMLIDRSEVFQDRPSYRFDIIIGIWNDK